MYKYPYKHLKPFYTKMALSNNIVIENMSKNRFREIS